MTKNRTVDALNQRLDEVSVLRAQSEKTNISKTQMPQIFKRVQYTSAARQAKPRERVVPKRPDNLPNDTKVKPMMVSTKVVAVNSTSLDITVFSFLICSLCIPLLTVNCLQAIPALVMENLN